MCAPFSAVTVVVHLELGMDVNPFIQLQQKKNFAGSVSNNVVLTQQDFGCICPPGPSFAGSC